MWFADVDCGSAIDCVSFDNMGNNESKDGLLPAKEGISFTKFPTVEKEGVTFLLYHMTITPEAIINMPITTNITRIILGEKLKGWSSSMFSIFFSNMSIGIGGSCSILDFSVLTSASVSSANLKSYHTGKY